MKRAITVIAGFAVLGAAWFFAGPLFIDERVDEAFEFNTGDGRLDMQKVMALTPAEREAARDEIMAAAAESPATSASDSMPAGVPTLVARGQFIDADSVHKGSGDALVYELPDGQHLVRFENFRTTNGPALVVYLAKHPAPGSAADVTDSGYVNLGKLKGNVGDQNYPVPVGTNIEEFGSVVIWCELFGVLFSPASIERS